MIHEGNQNVVLLLETLGECQQYMREIKHVMRQRTDIFGGDYGVRISHILKPWKTTSSTEQPIKRPRKPDSPGARFFASSIVSKQNELCLSWGTRFYFEKECWHTSSSLVLGIDSFRVSQEHWGIPITSEMLDPFEHLDQLMEYLLQQAKKHLMSAQEINLENPLLGTPYQALYPRILYLHENPRENENLDNPYQEIDGIWAEYRQIEKTLKESRDE